MTQRRTIALSLAGIVVLGALTLGVARWLTPDGSATPARPTTTTTTTASLGARPSPQIRFVEAVAAEYAPLLDGGWEPVLDAAEATCRDRQAGAGEPLVVDGAARRFAVAGRVLEHSDGMRLVRLLDDLRVCASFGLA